MDILHALANSQEIKKDVVFIDPYPPGELPEFLEGYANWRDKMDTVWRNMIMSLRVLHDNGLPIGKNVVVRFKGHAESDTLKEAHDLFGRLGFQGILPVRFTRRLDLYILLRPGRGSSGEFLNALKILVGKPDLMPMYSEKEVQLIVNTLFQSGTKLISASAASNGQHSNKVYDVNECAAGAYVHHLIAAD
jgi:hypothetical protein